MANLECPGCKRLVDESTKICPNCDYNIKKWVKELKKEAKRSGSKSIATSISLAAVYDNSNSKSLPKLDFLSSRNQDSNNEHGSVEMPIPKTNEAIIPDAEPDIPSFDSPLLNRQAQSFREASNSDSNIAQAAPAPAQAPAPIAQAAPAPAQAAPAPAPIAQAAPAPAPIAQAAQAAPIAQVAPAPTPASTPIAQPVPAPGSMAASSSATLPIGGGSSSMGNMSSGGAATLPIGGSSSFGSAGSMANSGAATLPIGGSSSVGNMSSGGAATLPMGNGSAFGNAGSLANSGNATLPMGGGAGNSSFTASLSSSPGMVFTPPTKKEQPMTSAPAPTPIAQAAPAQAVAPAPTVAPAQAAAGNSSVTSEKPLFDSPFLNARAERIANGQPADEPEITSFNPVFNGNNMNPAMRAQAAQAMNNHGNVPGRSPYAFNPVAAKAQNTMQGVPNQGGFNPNQPFAAPPKVAGSYNPSNPMLAPKQMPIQPSQITAPTAPVAAASSDAPAEKPLFDSPFLNAEHSRIQSGEAIPASQRNNDVEYNEFGTPIPKRTQFIPTFPNPQSNPALQGNAMLAGKQQAGFNTPIPGQVYRPNPGAPSTPIPGQVYTPSGNAPFTPQPVMYASREQQKNQGMAPYAPAFMQQRDNPALQGNPMLAGGRGTASATPVMMTGTPGTGVQNS